MMDVVIAAGASVCIFDGDGVWNLGGDPGALVVEDLGLAPGDRVRLYLFDAPEGSSMRVLAVAIIATDSSFERAVAAAGPIVDSVEFPTR